MPVLTSAPLIGGASKPITGRVALASTALYETATAVVTTVPQAGEVRDGQFYDLTGNQLEIPVTGENVGLRIVVHASEQGAVRGETTISRVVTVPDVATVAWEDLVDVVAAVTGGDYVIPPWASDVLTYKDQAAASATAAQTSETNAAGSATAADTAKVAAEAARDRAEAVPTSNDTIIAGRIDDTASATNVSLRARVRGDLSATDANQARLGLLRAVEPAGQMQALRRLREAILTRKTTPVRICAFGDSITAGSGAALNTRYATMFANELRALNPTNGSTVGGRGFLSTNPNNGTTAVLSGGAIAVQAGSLSYSPDQSVARLDVAGRIITYTIDGTGADLLYIKAAGANSFYWSVDGGAQTIVPTDATYSGTLSSVQIRGLTSGTHTVEIGYSSGTGATVISGLVEYKGDEDAGFTPITGGVGGTNTAFWTDTSKHWDHLPLYEPQAVIIALGTNDYSHSSGKLAASTYKTNLETMITEIKAHTTVDPSIILLTPAPTNATDPLDPWRDYKTVQHAIAAADPGNVCVFDWGYRMNPLDVATVADGLMGDDLVHPTVAGHEFIGKALARFVSVV